MHADRHRPSFGIATRAILATLIILIVAMAAVAALALHAARTRGELAQEARRQAECTSADFAAFRATAGEESAALHQRLEQLESGLEEAKRTIASEKDRGEEAETLAASRGQLADIYKRFFEKAVDEVATAARDDETITVRRVLDQAAHELKYSRVKEYRPQARAEAQYLLGWRYERIDEFEPAEEHFRRALELRAENPGADDEDTRKTMSQLAFVMFAQGKWDEAVELQRRVVEQVRASGERPAFVREALTPLNEYLIQAGRLDEAEEVFREITGMIREQGRYDGASDLMVLSFGAFLQRRGKLAEAEEVVREMLEHFRKEDGEDARHTFLAMCRLAWILQLRGKADEALPLHEKVTDTARFMREIHSPFISDTYGEYLTWRGEYEEAEYYLLEDLESGRKWYAHSARLNPYLQRLVGLYEAWGKPDLAEQYRRELTTRGEPEAAQSADS